MGIIQILYNRIVNGIWSLNPIIFSHIKEKV